MNAMDFPQMLPHRFPSEQDEALIIYEGEVSLRLNDLTISGIGRIVFEWSPTSGVAWEMRGVDATRFWVVGQKVELQIPGYENPIAARVLSAKLSGSGSGRLAGDIENGEGRKVSSTVRFIEFYLPNFTLFRGLPVRNEHGTELSSSRALLRAAGWMVTVDQIWKGSSSRRDLDGHFFLSHVCRLEKSDGADFTVDSARLLLDQLFWFFSFCRGLPTPPILPTGFDSSGREVWSELGSWNIHRYKPQRNWFNEFDSEGLEKLFPHFINRMGDEVWHQPTKLSIYWYLQAADVGSDSAIVLAQAAFELLAWSYFVEEQSLYSVDAFEQIPSKAILPLLLKTVPLDVNIPDCLKELRNAASERGWNDGPEALFGTRNTLLRPTLRNPTNVPTVRLLFEASQLTLWYLEMLLLRLLNYDGKYCNRLILEGWRGQDVKYVPWNQQAGEK